MHSLSDLHAEGNRMHERGVALTAALCCDGRNVLEASLTEQARARTLLRGYQLKNDSPEQVKTNLLLADPNSRCFLIIVLQERNTLCLKRMREITILLKVSDKTTSRLPINS